MPPVHRFAEFVHELQQLERTPIAAQGTRILDAIARHTRFDSGALYLRDGRGTDLRLAAKSLQNATHIVAPGYAHLVSPFGCAPRVIARFVDDGNAQRLPEDCVKSLRESKPPAFFVNRLEAKP